MAIIMQIIWELFRLLPYLILPRRVRRIQLCAALILFTTFTFVIYNFVAVLKTLGYIESYDVISLNPEYSNDPYVAHTVHVAYRKGWVGFSDLKSTNCKRALRHSKVRNSWYPAKSVQQIADSAFVVDRSKCTHFRKKFGYYRYDEATQEELNFPIAFIILFHKDFHQIHLLLRAIYHSHNVYCLAPDAKAGADLLAAAKSTASCLPNVFVASQLEKITYKGFSRLMADVNCMKDLMPHPVQWRYVINMPGQQFPLKTNLEMVRIFKNFHGANDIEGMTGLRALPFRFRRKYRISRNETTGEEEMVMTDVRHEPPPHGMRVVKGSAYNSYSRAFVHFVLTDGRVRNLLHWTRDVLSPDEYFWAMVNHNPSLRAPGGYKGIPSGKPHLALFAIWQDENSCATKFVREICILSPADIPLLLGSHALFANKFYLNHHPSALHCLDQMIFNRTVSGYVGDMDFYSDLKFAPPEETEKSKKDIVQFMDMMFAS